MARKPSVPERVRRQVQERAQGRCEYCLIREADMYYPHEADHVIAEKHGGPTSLENLAWACFYCNRFKVQTLLLLTQHQRRSSSHFIHVNRDGIAIFASMALELKELMPLTLRRFLSMLAYTGKKSPCNI